MEITTWQDSVNNNHDAQTELCAFGRTRVTKDFYLLGQKEIYQIFIFQHFCNAVVEISV